MSPSRFNKFLLLMLGASAACAQETPASIQIGAERSWVIAGRTLVLQAQALGEFGETLAVPLQWASSNPAIASVSSDGEVTGALPGRTFIEASARGVSGQFVVWVHPARIEITPGRVDLEVGGQSTLSARAVDADGRTIGGAAFTWFSTLPTVARIDAAGNLEGLTSGAVTITARMNVPDGGMSFSAQARATIRPRPPYRAERLVSSDLATSQLSIKTINGVSYSSDRAAFSASLSNGGQALMLYENGAVRKLAVAGEPIAGALIQSFGGVSINARGDVLALVYVTNGPSAVALFSNGKPPGQVELYQQPTQCCYCCAQVGDRSLADNGDFVYTINNGPRQELNLIRAGQTVRIPTDNLPGIGPAQWMSNVQVTGGQVIFNASGPSSQGSFLWDGRQVVKLISAGDYILGRAVQWYDRPIAGAPGEIYARVAGSDYQMIARWSAGAWTKLVDGWSILHDAAGGAVLAELNGKDGAGLYRVTANESQRLMSIGGPNGFLWLRQAFLRSDGSALAIGPSGNVHGRMSRVGGGSETPLYETGRAVNFSAPLAVNWNGLSGGGSGNTLITRTVSGALVRLEPNKAEILRSPGDLLADGSFIDWVGVHATAPNGDVIAEAGSSRGPRLYQYRQRTLTELVGPDRALRLSAGEELSNFSGRLAVNNRGQIAAFVRVRDSVTRFESNKLILFTDSDRQARTVYVPGVAAPGGGTLGWPDEMTLDEQGRIWFTSRTTSDTQSLFVWDNGTIRRLHNSGEAMSDGRRLPGFNGLKYANGRLYFSSFFPNSAHALMETDGTRMRYAISHLEPTSFGAQINFFPYGGQFRIGPGGEIAYIAQLATQPTTLIVHKPDGTDVMVARQGERASNGAWIDSLLDIAWSDQGRLFFSTTTLGLGDRADLFLTTPQ